MIAISVQPYPTTRWNGRAERASSASGVGLFVPWSRSAPLATMKTTLRCGMAEAEPKPNVERQRSANPGPDGARAPRAASSSGVAFAARRD
jgi:hypothetical protein